MLAKEFFAELVHGSFERGADIILLIPKEKDFLGRGVVVFIQVKKGDVTLPIWRNSLHSQLYELYDREIDSQFTPSEVSRRIVLITSGEIKESVKHRIALMNRRHHLPVEFFDGQQLTSYLIDKGVTKREAEDLMVQRNF